MYLAEERLEQQELLGPALAPRQGQPGTAEAQREAQGCFHDDYHHHQDVSAREGALTDGGLPTGALAGASVASQQGSQLEGGMQRSRRGRAPTNKSACESRGHPEANSWLPCMGGLLGQNARKGLLEVLHHPQPAPAG